MPTPPEVPKLYLNTNKRILNTHFYIYSTSLEYSKIIQLNESNAKWSEEEKSALCSLHWHVNADYTASVPAIVVGDTSAQEMRVIANVIDTVSYLLDVHACVQSPNNMLISNQVQGQHRHTVQLIPANALP